MSVILFTSLDSPLKVERTLRTYSKLRPIKPAIIAIIQNHSLYLKNEILFFYFTLISTIMVFIIYLC